MQKRLLLALMVGAWAMPAQAQDISAFGAVGTGTVNIKKIRTGWDSDQFAIETVQPIVNPAGCASPDGYAAGAAQRGYKEHYAAALSAMYSGRPVSIVVSDLDCASGRPRIMGLHVIP